MTTVSWRYQGAGYVRSQNGEPHFTVTVIDGDPEPLSVDTVLVLFAAERSAGYQDANGALVPTFDVIGSGRFLLFHGGEVVEGEWRRAAQQDGYVLLGPDGADVLVPPGRIFVEIVPRTVIVTWG